MVQPPSLDWSDWLRWLSSSLLTWVLLLCWPGARCSSRASAFSVPAFVAHQERGRFSYIVDRGEFQANTATRVFYRRYHLLQEQNRPRRRKQVLLFSATSGTRSSTSTSIPFHDNDDDYQYQSSSLSSEPSSPPQVDYVDVELAEELAELGVKMDELQDYLNQDDEVEQELAQVDAMMNQLEAYIQEEEQEQANRRFTDEDNNDPNWSVSRRQELLEVYERAKASLLMVKNIRQELESLKYDALNDDDDDIIDNEIMDDHTTNHWTTGGYDNQNNYNSWEDDNSKAFDTMDGFCSVNQDVTAGLDDDKSDHQQQDRVGVGYDERLADYDTTNNWTFAEYDNHNNDNNRGDDDNEATDTMDGFYRVNQDVTGFNGDVDENSDLKQDGSVVGLRYDERVAHYDTTNNWTIGGYDNHDNDNNRDDDDTEAIYTTDRFYRVNQDATGFLEDDGDDDDDDDKSDHQQHIAGLRYDERLVDYDTTKNWTVGGHDNHNNENKRDDDVTEAFNTMDPFYRVNQDVTSLDADDSDHQQQGSFVGFHYDERLAVPINSGLQIGDMDDDERPPHFVQPHPPLIPPTKQTLRKAVLESSYSSSSSDDNFCWTATTVDTSSDNDDDNVLWPREPDYDFVISCDDDDYEESEIDDVSSIFFPSRETNFQPIKLSSSSSPSIHPDMIDYNDDAVSTVVLHEQAAVAANETPTNASACRRLSSSSFPSIDGFDQPLTPLFTRNYVAGVSSNICRTKYLSSNPMGPAPARKQSSTQNAKTVNLTEEAAARNTAEEQLAVPTLEFAPLAGAATAIEKEEEVDEDTLSVEESDDCENSFTIPTILDFLSKVVATEPSVVFSLPNMVQQQEPPPQEQELTLLPLSVAELQLPTTIDKEAEEEEATVSQIEKLREENSNVMDLERQVASDETSTIGSFSSSPPMGPRAAGKQDEESALAAVDSFGVLAGQNDNCEMSGIVDIDSSFFGEDSADFGESQELSTVYLESKVLADETVALLYSAIAADQTWPPSYSPSVTLDVGSLVVADETVAVSALSSAIAVDHKWPSKLPSSYSRSSTPDFRSKVVADETMAISSLSSAIAADQEGPSSCSPSFTLDVGSKVVADETAAVSSAIAATPKRPSSYSPSLVRRPKQWMELQSYVEQQQYASQEQRRQLLERQLSLRETGLPSPVSESAPLLEAKEELSNHGLFSGHLEQVKETTCRASMSQITASRSYHNKNDQIEGTSMQLDPEPELPPNVDNSSDLGSFYSMTGNSNEAAEAGDSHLCTDPDDNFQRTHDFFNSAPDQRMGPPPWQKRFAAAAVVKDRKPVPFTETNWMSQREEDYSFSTNSDITFSRPTRPTGELKMQHRNLLLRNDKQVLTPPLHLDDHGRDNWNGRKTTPTPREAPIPLIVKGGSVKTPRFTSSQVQRFELTLQSDNCPIQALVDLFQGPDEVPQQIEIFTENGRENPFHAIIETPGDNNALAIHNLGSLSFPISSKIDVEHEDVIGWAGGRMTNSLLYAAKQQLGFSLTAVKYNVPGGTVRSVRLDDDVTSAQILLTTSGRCLCATIEIFNGPGNAKQTMDIYSVDGETRPFFVTVHTPHDGGTMVFIYNNAPSGFSLSAQMEAYTTNVESDWRCSCSGPDTHDTQRYPDHLHTLAISQAYRFEDFP